MKCQYSGCINEATVEFQVKSDGMLAFKKDDESKDGLHYEWRPTRQCDEHAKEIREKNIIQSEINI